MSEWISVALPKGRLGDKVYRMFARAGYPNDEIEKEGRQLVFESPECGVRYFLVKPSDVPMYVERGAADIGVCGSDILMEYEPDVYELLDLKTGICRMAVAAKEDFSDDCARALKVATKFPKTARDYYGKKGRKIDVIRLSGSIELAPVLGLSDVIVDIVETGTTLRENHLKVFDTVAPISARLIANRAAFRFKRTKIEELTEQLRRQTEERK